MSHALVEPIALFCLHLCPQHDTPLIFWPGGMLTVHILSDCKETGREHKKLQKSHPSKIT